MELHFPQLLECGGRGALFAAVLVWVGEGAHSWVCILRSHSFPSPLTLKKMSFHTVFVLSWSCTAHIRISNKQEKNHLTQKFLRFLEYLVYLLFSLFHHLLIIALCISSTGFFL